MRGGSFLNRLPDVRTTVRWATPDEDNGTKWLGFRCASAVKP
jgi:formylglycine-generating enzyme required for sulfatase activity